MKSFGPKGKKMEPAERIPFEFTVMRDDEPETHQFQAVVKTDAAALAYTLSSVEKHPERSLIGMMMMISKMLDNKDGTPAQWAADPLPRPSTTDDDDDDDQPVKFRGPDGELYPMEESARFTDRAAGSSRRRWLHLMEQDHEVIADAADLTRLFEWLVGLAGKERTGQSS